MKKNSLNVKVSLDEEKGEVKVTISEEAKSKIPRPGESIYVITPYPIVTADMVGEDLGDGFEVTEEDVKEDLPEAYSYDSVMVRGSVLTEDCEEVMINGGDYKIPLYEKSSRKKQLVFNNENEARDKFRTLMNVSVKETARREALHKTLKVYLEESLEKMHH
jgi:hypothetical protein